MFPDVAVKMAEVGESTGALQDMLNTVADFYDEEIATNLERFVTLVEPVLLVLMGIVIAGLLLALYMPLFQLSSVLSVIMDVNVPHGADSRHARSYAEPARRSRRAPSSAGRGGAGAPARRALPARVRRHGHVPDRPGAVPVDSGRPDAALRVRAVPPRRASRS